MIFQRIPQKAADMCINCFSPKARFRCFLTVLSIQHATELVIVINEVTAQVLRKNIDVQLTHVSTNCRSILNQFILNSAFLIKNGAEIAKVFFFFYSLLRDLK